MSCGKPHETPCTEVLEQVYWYLDGQVSDDDCEHIRQHLDECGPCLREFAWCRYPGMDARVLSGR